MRKVYVSQTKSTGKGLFAKKDFKKDEVLFVIKGTIRHGAYISGFYSEGPNWVTIAKNTWLSPFDQNPWRYINHSCDPNAGLKGKVTVVAMKNIKKDEQVTIDYSITEDDPYWKMNCRCGEKNCRKVIKSIRYLPLKIFRKYDNYIPNYLKKSYLKCSRKAH